MNRSDTTQFNPQIAALAMPQEGEFKAAADGIANIGKVFLDAEERQSAQALNALKMEEANQSILAKKNENSIFGETQERARESHLLEKRNKTLDGLKKEVEWKADVKKQTENGFMDQFKKLVPSQTFIDPKTGTFSDELYQAKRNEFKSAGGFASENIHLFDALADGYRKEALEADKTKSEIGNKKALSAKTIEETKWVAPKANADIAQSKASANKSNVEASLAPTKVSIDRDREDRLGNGSGVEGDLKTRKGRETHIAMGRMANLLPDYDSLTGTQKNEVNKIFVEKGVLPKSLKEVDGQFQAVYPAGTLSPVIQPKSVSTKKPSSSQPKNSNYNDEISRLLNK
jgi:hypothetical protein